MGISCRLDLLQQILNVLVNLNTIRSNSRKSQGYKKGALTTDKCQMLLCLFKCPMEFSAHDQILLRLSQRPGGICRSGATAWIIINARIDSPLENVLFRDDTMA